MSPTLLNALKFATAGNRLSRLARARYGPSRVRVSRPVAAGCQAPSTPR